MVDTALAGFALLATVGTSFEGIDFLRHMVVKLGSKLEPEVSRASADTWKRRNVVQYKVQGSGRKI